MGHFGNLLPVLLACGIHQFLYILWNGLDKQQDQQNRKPVALLGKVFCKVDADFAPIAVGDLLTTSDTLGHAMKASDPLQAFGAIVGKAMHPLKAGKGLIPILIALQ